MSSPAKGIILDGDKSTLGSSNTFVAQNDLFDIDMEVRVRLRLGYVLKYVSD